MPPCRMNSQERHFSRWCLMGAPRHGRALERQRYDIPCCHAAEAAEYLRSVSGCSARGGRRRRQQAAYVGICQARTMLAAIDIVAATICHGADACAMQKIAMQRQYRLDLLRWLMRRRPRFERSRGAPASAKREGRRRGFLAARARTRRRFLPPRFPRRGSHQHAKCRLAAALLMMPTRRWQLMQHTEVPKRHGDDRRASALSFCESCCLAVAGCSGAMRGNASAARRCTRSPPHHTA